MRLKSLWVDGFKNLNDFKIDFESRDGITVLIGNNASGKSNILEAISAIFAGLYNKKPEKIPFKFDLIYRITNLRFQEATPKELDIRISKKHKVRYRIKKLNESSWKIIKKLHRMADNFSIIAYGMDANNMDTGWVGAKDPFDYRPSQIIALYSGEELRLWENYYQKPYFDYNEKSLKSDSYLSKQKMLYINKYYWDIALLTMIASDIDIKEIIPSQVKTIKLTIDIDRLSDFLTSKPNNVVNNFVWDLLVPDDWVFEDLTIAEVALDDYYDIQTTISLNLDNFKSKTNFTTHNELFDLLRVARLPKDQKHKLITDLELKFKNGTTTKDLSEGQKKQILLKLALEVLANENSLLLFDEPDAHIHIANKKLIPEMLKKYDNREIVLTTHSPTLAHSFDNKHLAYLDNGEINIDYNSQNELLNSLTGGLMGVSEQQIFLQSKKNLILLVEGNTDKKHIETALEKLKDDYQNLDFDVFSMGGAVPLKQFIQGFKSSEACDSNKTYIVIFDNDDEGKKCYDKIGSKEYTNKNHLHKITENIYRQLLLIDGTIENMYPHKRLKEAYEHAIASVDSGFNAKDIEENAKNHLAACCQKFYSKDFKRFKKLFNKILEIKNQALT